METLTQTNVYLSIEYEKLFLLYLVGHISFFLCPGAGPQDAE